MMFLNKTRIKTFHCIHIHGFHYSRLMPLFLSLIHLETDASLTNNALLLAPPPERDLCVTYVWPMSSYCSHIRHVLCVLIILTYTTSTPAPPPSCRYISSVLTPQYMCPHTAHTTDIYDKYSLSAASCASSAPSRGSNTSSRPPVPCWHRGVSGLSSLSTDAPHSRSKASRRVCPTSRAASSGEHLNKSPAFSTTAQPCSNFLRQSFFVPGKQVLLYH